MSRQNDKIVWGIMATGSIARKFATTVYEMKKYEHQVTLGAVASRNIEVAKAFAKEYDIVRAYGSYENLVKDPNIDIIYIATPNAMHYQNVKLCLEHGKNVLCEKPFTCNKEQALELFELAQESGLFLAEAFWIQHLPLLKKVQSIVEDGEIGQVLHIRSEFGFISHGKRLERKFDLSLGGGSLLDIGIYNIGFTGMFLGLKPEEIVSSMVKNDAGTDSLTSAVLKYSNQSTASFTCAIGAKMPTVGVIYGTKGTITLPDFQLAQTAEVKLYDGESYTIEMPVEINGFEYQILDAMESIRQGKVESSAMHRDKTLGMLDVMDKIRKQQHLRYLGEK